MTTPADHPSHPDCPAHGTDHQPYVGGCLDCPVCISQRQLTQVRDLHKPVQITYRRSIGHECHGCEQGPHPEGYPDWPCNTAEIVYTAEEIQQLKTFERTQDQRIEGAR